MRYIILLSISLALLPLNMPKAYAEELDPLSSQYELPQFQTICVILRQLDHNDTLTTSASGKDVSSASYVPGVDVHGKPVASADLNATKKSDAPMYRFDFNIDIAKRYFDLPKGVELNTKTIPLYISQTGQVSLGDADRTQELRSLCNEHYGQATTP